ncbi:MAG: HIT domain-containing protein [Candidatus Falkowbacteria bacterium]
MNDKHDFYCEEVISGKTPIEKLYESNNILAFYHTRPSYKIHIVITSKKHILDLPSVADEELTILNEIINVARDLSKNLNKKDGIRLITNAGKFQDSPHIHFHLVAGEKLK